MKPDASLFVAPRSTGISRRLPYLKVLALAVLALAVAVPQAQAVKTIGGFIGGTGGLNPLPGGNFTQPRDVTVYTGTDGDAATDKIFSVEGLGGNSRVQRLAANGDFELAWGKDVDAANPSTGFEICTDAADCKAGANTSAGAGELNQPSGIAVDQANGWVYVFDRVNDRVQKFDLGGNFILMLGLDVNATTAGSGFEICTQASGDTCKAGVTGTDGGAINGSTGGVPKLEVAQGTSDLFVADPSNRRVSQFQSDGTFVRAWGWDVDKATADNRFEICTVNCGAAADAAPATSNGAFVAGSPANVAVDSQNVVYATDAASGADAQRVLRFDADLAPGAPGDASAALLAAIDPTTAGGPLLANLSTAGVNGIEIDPDSDGAGPDEETLLAVRDPDAPTSAATVVQELDIPTEGGETPADAVTVLDTHTFDAQAVNGGIGVQSQTGNIYLPVALATDDFPACGLLIPGCVNGMGLIILNSGGGAGAVTALQPTAVTATTATLTGTVTANGRAFYRFEVAKGGGAFTQVGPTRSVSGSSPVAVSLAATGLSPNALYRMRIVVSKISSLTTIATADSNEPLFLTQPAPPDATTLAASGITSSGALLAGRVDPNGSETTYQFRYGLTNSYGSVAPASPQLIGAADGDQIVSEQVGQLLPEKTYHYQLCATSPAGAQCGTDRTFTTKAGPGGGGLERAYELVSPADKVSGSGVGSWYFGPGDAGTAGFAAHTGERFAATGVVGSVLLDSAFGYGNDWAFAQRTASGWVSHSPITRGGYGSQTYRLVNAPGGSDDLSQMVFTSSGTLKPFPEMEPWPELGQVSFVSDWDGRWEVIAPTDPAQVTSASGIGSLTVAQAAASRHVAISTGELRGLLGPADPTNVAWGDLVAGGSVYLDDLSAGVSDTFPGTGVRALVNVCTGTGGVDRTEIPLRTSGGKQGAQECPAAGAGRSGRLISERGGALPFQTLDSGISTDGSRVFFLSPDPGAGGAGESSCDTAASGEATKCPAQLYVRQRNADGAVVTRWISRSEVADQDASLMAPVVFEGMSEDGDKVFFRTTAPLTADDPNGAGVAPPAGGVTTGAPSSASSDLYMYDLPDGTDADPAGGVLTRVSGGPDGAGDCNVPNAGAGTGSLRFVSSDGGRAYFTCAGTLAGVGASSNGTLTEPGGDAATTATANLYLYDGSWRFVTQLPRQGGERIGACATVGGGSGAQTLAVVNSTTSGIAVRGDNCVQGTSDGAFVTFWTAGRLTADDLDTASADFYGFDADADELTRITAAQGGPGGTYTCNNASDTVNGPLQCFGDGGFTGGYGAETNRVAAPLNVVEDPAVPGDRIALFQSKSRLVAEDSDDAYDVYQWRNGELSLVSTGASGRDGAFLKGSDSTGTNVYFATRDRLSWQDVDSVLDIYTARVGGGIPEPPPPPICAVLAGNGCQGTGGAAPVAADVGSSSSGGGNEAAKERMRLSVASPSARARAGAARRGVLALRVRVSQPGVITVSSRAGGKSGAATSRVRARKAGVVTVRLRLSRPVRKRLGRGQAVRLAMTVASPGAHERTLTTTLKRGSR